MHCVGGDDVHVTWRIVYSLNMYTRWGFFVVVCDLRWLENLTIALIYDVSVSYGKSKISWWFKQLSMCIEEEEKEEKKIYIHWLAIGKICKSSITYWVAFWYDYC